MQHIDFLEHFEREKSKAAPEFCERYYVDFKAVERRIIAINRLFKVL